MRQSPRKLYPWFFFIFTMLLQALFTYVVLQPQVGFDDANITQVYGRHFAEGYGFVYNVGGERVEGSTSLIWTLLNAAMFLTPHPITMITGFCFLLTAGTLFLSGRICRDLGGSDAAVSTVYLLFNLFPGFFAWSYWALMDITLWIFVIVAMISAILRTTQHQTPSTSSSITLFIGAAALPLVRPEGIVFVLAASAFMFLHGKFTGRDTKIGLLIACLGIASVVAVTFWRLSYFDYPVPNTFYAKTSTDIVGQLKQGIIYILRFINEPAIAILLILSGIGVAVLRVSKDFGRQSYGLLAPLFLVGAFSLYAALGGDHFGSYRFFLFLIPVCLPIVAIMVLYILEKPVGRWGSSIAIGTFSLYFFQCLFTFYQNGGGVRHELRIAENYRQVGMVLAEIRGLPTVATIPAGGIKMTYPGTVYDVLGLNWTTMAHSNETDTSVTKNHGGFNADVFFEAQPNVVFPRLGECLDDVGSVEGDFGKSVTRRVSETDRFRDDYLPMCNHAIVMYVAKELADNFQTQGFQFYQIE